jgi:hypothetical protein
MGMIRECKHPGVDDAGVWGGSDDEVPALEGYAPSIYLSPKTTYIFTSVVMRIAICADGPAGAATSGSDPKCGSRS